MKNIFKSLSLLCLVWVCSAISAGAQMSKGTYEQMLKGAEATPFMSLYKKYYDTKVFFPYQGMENQLEGKDPLKVLDTYYHTLNKEAKKVKTKTLRQLLNQLNEDAHLSYLYQLLPDSASQKNELVRKIDVNNVVGLYNGLPQLWMRTHMDMKLDSLLGHDTTEYGLAYIQLLNQNVTNPDVRHDLLDECGFLTLMGGRDIKDVDRFWKPFCEAASGDSLVVAKYADKAESIRHTKKGMMAPDFTFHDQEGKLHRLADMRGKVLYIDCWATWCKPCCNEIPYLAKRVEEYKGNDKIRFISISMDSKKQAWLDKLSQDKPEWEQYILNEEEKNAMSKAYGIVFIPRFLLINADGTIANSDAFRPSAEDFHQQLDAVLNK